MTKFGTILATAHSVTDRFGPVVWYLPEDNVINSKMFLWLDWIEKYPCWTMFFNKSPVTRVLNSYKNSYSQDLKKPIKQTSYFSYIFNMKVGWYLEY